MINIMEKSRMSPLCRENIRQFQNKHKSQANGGKVALILAPKLTARYIACINFWKLSYYTKICKLIIIKR